MKLFRFFVFFLLTFALCTLYFVLRPQAANAQVPKIKLPCDVDPNPDFHSLRPAQAAPCGDAGKALYCSNNLVFTEDFNVAGFGNCNPRHQDGNFECNPQAGHAMGAVPPHDLFISLDNSQFPIEGNTENVKNSQNGSDEFDDATKVNEYVSWYLSGVNNRAEYGIPTEDQIVNYSGPVQKLIPQAILQAVRISSIEKAKNLVTFSEEADTAGDPAVTVTGPETHNQVVVCESGGKPVACPAGTGLRLKDWEGSLSIFRTLSNAAIDLVSKIPGIGNAIGSVVTDAWNNRKPPLPWSDKDGKPFKTTLDYQKAYNEWLGKSCVIAPLINTLLCFDNPGVTNKYADLFSYVPLSVTPDKKGAEWIADVQIHPSNGTEIDPKTYGKVRSAPLYFAHTEETKDASALLNTTYAPKDVKSIPLPASTEKNNCSIVNVRTNPGDNLFPGDPDEMQVNDVTYTITQAKCEEKHRIETICPQNKAKCGGQACCEQEINEFSCNAEVTITLITDTKTPFADELFSQTVADSQSTFRKIYPKVDANAPVYCIADIPTVTNVTYDATKSQPPKGGEQTFSVKKNPKDGAEESPQLAFPHIGSVYDYFLKGIQTALRPQGFGGEQPVSAQTCTNIACGELPKGLAKAAGSCSLGDVGLNINSSLKQIVESAAQTYNTPSSLIIGIMYGEGLFNPDRFNWTDQNVKNWATCMKIPNCNETGDDNFMGFNGTVFEQIVPKIKADLLKVDPTRKTFSQCNLLDSIYAISYNLHASASGGGGLPATCYGINLNTTIPNNCSWTNSQYEAAIKVSESGYTSYCLTKPGSCATGGGLDAACDNGDNCEKFGGSGNTSHNACVFDISTSGGSGNKK